MTDELFNEDSNWIDSEFTTIDLKDKRLNKRFKSILANFESNPTQSIPQSCLGWHKSKAAYRFLENENVNWEAILTPHFEASLTRMAQHLVVLCLQDTTELNFNGRETEGAGP